MPKDEPGCVYRDLGIDLWNCEGDTDPVYIQGDMIGYRAFCSTCYASREQNFVVGECRDVHCFGNKRIEMTGGEVAFYHRKKLDDPSFTYPPLRCKACRDWLRGLAQEKRTCTACRNIFVIAPGVLAHTKKYVGDPAEAGLFCPRCERLSAEERTMLVQKQVTYDAFRQEHRLRFRAKKPLSVQFRLVDPLSGTSMFRNPASLLGSIISLGKALRGDEGVGGDSSSPFRLLNVEGPANVVTHLVPEVPGLDGRGLHFAGKTIAPSPPQVLSVTDWKGDHPERHLTQFRPTETLEQFRINNDALLKNTNPEQVIQVYQPKTERDPEAIVKIDLRTQRCVLVAPKEDRLRTAFPISVSKVDGRSNPSVTLQKVSVNVQAGRWQIM